MRRTNLLAASILAALACSRDPRPVSASPDARAEQAKGRASAAAVLAEEQGVLEDPGHSEASATTGSTRSPAAETVDLASVEISVERTTCRGWCPSYTLTIHGDGTVKYVGRNYVRELGEREDKISERTVRELLARFDAMHFLDLEGKYADNVKDAPSTILGLKRDGRSKRVTNLWSRAASERGDTNPKAEAHRRLDELAESIEKAVDIEQWIAPVEEREAVPGHYERPRPKQAPK